MTASAAPAVIDALIALGNTLPNINVHDGVATTLDPGDFLMVGVEDPDIEGAAFSADGSQDWAWMGPDAPTSEEGDVTCVALSWNGDGDAKLARDTAHTIITGLLDAISADVTLGIPYLLHARFGKSIQFSQAQGEGGASAYFIFRIHYSAQF